MLGDNSSRVERVELAINMLSQALNRLHQHDYATAQVQVAMACQVLEEVQLDFDLHWQVKSMLEQLLE
jgi:pyruvate formate-lyase activating enzyme-like uncharacterized protein